MEAESSIIINKKSNNTSNRNLFRKINAKINIINKVLFFFVFTIILIIIFTFIIIFKNYIKLSLLYKNILDFKNEINIRISKIEEILKIKGKMDVLNQTSTYEISNLKSNSNEKLEFNSELIDGFIKEQNNFCKNQNEFYNKEFEDKIKLFEIKFENKIFNMYIYKKDDIISNDITRRHNFELEETKKLMKALTYYSNKLNIGNEDIYILDIGANIGWYTFLFGKYGYKIISFEPSKLNNYILKKNYCINKEVNVTLINKGLYSEEKICDIYNAISNEGNGIVICKDNETIPKLFLKNKTGEISLTKLNNYMPFLLTKKIVLIKIDAEGSEGKAFEGGIELITKYHIPFIYLEFTPYYLKLHGTDPKEFIKLFDDNGYKFSTLNFFSNFISAEDIMRKNLGNFGINLYIVHSKILE